MSAIRECLLLVRSIDFTPSLRNKPWLSDITKFDIERDTKEIIKTNDKYFNLKIYVGHLLSTYLRYWKFLSNYLTLTYNDKDSLNSTDSFSFFSFFPSTWCNLPYFVNSNSLKLIFYFDVNDYEGNFCYYNLEWGIISIISITYMIWIDVPE